MKGQSAAKRYHHCKQKRDEPAEPRTEHDAKHCAEHTEPCGVTQRIAGEVPIEPAMPREPENIGAEPHVACLEQEHRTHCCHDQ